TSTGWSCSASRSPTRLAMVVLPAEGRPVNQTVTPCGVGRSGALVAKATVRCPLDARGKRGQSGPSGRERGCALRCAEGPPGPGTRATDDTPVVKGAVAGEANAGHGPTRCRRGPESVNGRAAGARGGPPAARRG